MTNECPFPGCRNAAEVPIMLGRDGPFMYCPAHARHALKNYDRAYTPVSEGSTNDGEDTQTDD